MAKHRPLLMALLLIVVHAWSGSAGAEDFGSFTLGPGEARSIRIGSTYRDVRVCNDLGSRGSITATIGDHDPVTLAPGICRRDSGDRIALSNDSAADASGLFRSYRSLPMHGGR